MRPKILITIPTFGKIVNFAQSHIVFVLILLISPSMSYAETLYECKGYNGCFDPELSIEVGDVFNWDVLGVNITDQINTFEWRERRLTNIKLEIQEDIKGLSTSIQSNFGNYFELTFTLDGIETDYSQDTTGLIFGIISYTMKLDENGELYNIFIREVQNDRKYNYTNVVDFNNYTVYKYRYGNTVIENGIYMQFSYSYQYVTLKNDSSNILSTTETFIEKRIDVETGVLLIYNDTRLFFDQIQGNQIFLKTTILDQEVNQYMELIIGDYNSFQLMMIAGLTIGMITVMFVLRRKYNYLC